MLRLLLLANHDGLAEGILLALVLTGVAGIAAIATLGVTVWAIATRNAARSRRLSYVDFGVAALCVVAFFVARPSADAAKLLIPAGLFAVAGVAARRVTPRA